MLVWRKGNINTNCLCVTVLCTIIMVHKDTSSSYRSVDCCLYRALILLGLALCVPSDSVFSVLMVLYRYYFFLLASFSLPFSELSLVGLALDVVE